MPMANLLPHYNILKKWEVTDMCNWLRTNEFHDAIPFFKKNFIGGEKFAYLSDMQVFQMRNVSTKTRNGLKDAQKTIKGRPTAPKTTVIMNSDKPPQLPGKDYHHATHDADDGWGSDFSDDEDFQDNYVEPVSNDIYEETDSNSDNYEEPNQHMPKPSPQMPRTVPIQQRPLPKIKDTPKPTIFLGSKDLPPEPTGEVYENPEPEEYENPEEIISQRKPPHNPPRQPKMVPPPRQPQRSNLPPPVPTSKTPKLPPRTKPTEPVQTSHQSSRSVSSDDEYEAPTQQVVRSPMSEIDSKPGRLKPSELVKNKVIHNNIPKAEVKNSRPTHMTSGCPKPKPVEKKSRSPSPSRSLQHTPVRPKSALPPPPQDTDDSLSSYTWFHGNMTRMVATERLNFRSLNGMFLVRKSSQHGSPFALSLFYGGRVYNLNIRLRPDKKYALGTKKPDEQAFTGVPLLISYYQNNILVLGGNDSTKTKLVQALPK